MDLTGLDWPLVGKALVGGLPVLVTLAGLSRGPGVLRTRLRHDVELLNKLPEGSVARTRYEEYLSRQIDRFSTAEVDSSRDIRGLIISAILVLGFGALGLWLVTLNVWCWIPAVGLWLFCLGGLISMFDDAQRVPRNDKKKPI